MPILLPLPERLHRIGDRTHDGWTPLANVVWGWRSGEAGHHQAGLFLNPDGGLSDRAWHQGRMALIAASGAFVWVERRPAPSGRTSLHLRVPPSVGRFPGGGHVPWREAIPTRRERSRFGMDSAARHRQIRAGGEGLPAARVAEAWRMLELAATAPPDRPTLFEGAGPEQLGLL